MITKPMMEKLFGIPNLFPRNSGYHRICSTSHRMSSSRLYKVWENMKSRCDNKNHPFYRYYGSRGITVCDDWNNSFLAFYEWAISHGYGEKLQIDRIDNDKGYNPFNCRFITQKENLRNKKTFLDSEINFYTIQTLIKNDIPFEFIKEFSGLSPRSYRKR